MGVRRWRPEKVVDQADWLGSVSERSGIRIDVVATVFDAMRQETFKILRAHQGLRFERFGLLYGKAHRSLPNRAISQDEETTVVRFRSTPTIHQELDQ